MKYLISIVCLLLTCCAYLPAQSQRIIALKNGRIITSSDLGVIEKGILIFSQDKIIAVGDTSLAIPKEAMIINVAGKTIMPGMIEGNGHVTFDGQFDHALYWTENIDQLYQIGSTNLISTLQQGITTLRDTKGPLEVMLQLKEDSRNGVIAGSRLYTCGLILNYGSFGQLFDAVDNPDSGIDPARIRQARQALIEIVKDKDHGIHLVREYAQKGVDFIKVSAFSTKNEQPPTMPFQVLQAIIEEAHHLGLKTTTHAMSASSVEASIDAGSDAIEHPQLTSATVLGAEKVISPALAQKMAKQKVFAVPLMVAADVYLRYYSDPNRLDTDENLKLVPKNRLAEGKENVYKFLEEYPNAPQIYQSRASNRLQNMRNLIEAGVPIAMGTDRGTRLNYHQSANHIRELEIYVELGMSPLEALHSATINGARLLGIEDQLGSLEAGKLADILVIDGNPLNDIRVLSNVEVVFKAGIRYK